MSKVITFSRYFPAYHPNKGQPTYFVEKIFNGLVRLKMPIQSTGLNYDCELSNDEKYHTIRSGNRWKVGEKFSPRVWSGKPYNSPMVTIAPDIEIKKIWTFEIRHYKKQCLVLIDDITIENHPTFLQTIARNDGLSFVDFLQWFQYPKEFKGQIICWNEKINYLNQGEQ